MQILGLLYIVIKEGFLNVEIWTDMFCDIRYIRLRLLAAEGYPVLNCCDNQIYILDFSQANFRFYEGLQYQFLFTYS